MARRILITGASVAGNTAAWWLGRYGFDVTVVERMAEFRDGGQNVDVRGVGREVLRRMGLERAALDRGTGEEGTAWVDDQGRVVAQFKLGEGGREGPTAEMEILRGDLAELLYGPARDHAAFRFDDSVQQIVDGDRTASVTFASGRVERFDAVIVAEGVGSRTREHVFPGENDPRWMDLAIAFFTIPRASTDDRLWRWYNATEGRGVSLRPDRHGTARAMLISQGANGGEQDWDIGRQKAHLRERFEGAGWETTRVLAGMADTEDFYYDALRQVRLKRWSKGRVVLLGDAAWCATPLAGIGTTLAVAGAYVLAGELSLSTDVTGAFAAFEAAMRPMVDRAHGLPKFVPRLMHPRSRMGIRMLHNVLRLASTPAARKLGAWFPDRSAAEPDLSRYAGAAMGRSASTAS